MKFLRKFFLITFLITLPSQSFANEAADVQKFINDLGNKIIKIASDKKFTINQKRDKLINLIDTSIDADWVSKFVLGKYYRTATDEQKSQFRKLYREFLIHTYSPKFTGYNGEKFEITSIVSEENYYTAKCLFYPKKDEPVINLDFRVRKNTKSTEPQFFVFDIIAEGISLIETQRSEFGSVIAKDGLDKFLVDLEGRIKKMKAENAKPQKAKVAVSN